jgi:hypothetical protein
MIYYKVSALKLFQPRPWPELLSCGCDLKKRQSVRELTILISVYYKR